MQNRPSFSYLDSVDDKKRRAALSEISDRHGWRLVQDVTMRMLDGSSLYNLACQDRSYRNYIFGDDWEYVEVSFQARGQSGLSRFKKRRTYYGVMRLPLPRRLPNVVFDSHVHQRRQFRVIFDGRQHIRLEGNFNKYFDTYFGEDYTIDDLSFITPDVMQALIDARDYDVEIVYDSLLLFGQLQANPEAQLLDMIQAIKLIRKRLRNNIVAYLDERVPYDQGRHVVARAGMFLARRPIRSLVTMYITGVLYLVVLAAIIVVISIPLYLIYYLLIQKSG